MLEIEDILDVFFSIFDVHRVPLTTSSVTTNTRLQRADFFASN